MIYIILVIRYIYCDMVVVLDVEVWDVWYVDNCVIVVFVRFGFKVEDFSRV